MKKSETLQSEHSEGPAVFEIDETDTGMVIITTNQAGYKMFQELLAMYDSIDEPSDSRH